MFDLLEFCYQIIDSPYLVLATFVMAFAIKTYLIGFLAHKGLRSISIPRPWFFLIGILLGSMVGDISWVVKISRQILFPKSNYAILAFFIRFAWAFLIIQYQSIALFIESLTQAKFKLNKWHKFIITLSTLFFFYFLYIAFFDSHLTNEFLRNYAFSNPAAPNAPLEVLMMRFTVIYLLNLLILPGLLFSFIQLRIAQIPKILKKQTKIIIQYLIFPYMIAEFILAIHFNFTELHMHTFTIMNISNLLITYAVFYSIKRVMGLRFLNFNKQVISHFNPNFINSFKQVLEQLAHAASNKELDHITQQFFKDSFTINPKKTHFFVRTYDNQATYLPNNYNHIEEFVEELMQSHPDCSLYEFILREKILIYDELNFSNFYQDDADRTLLIEFLNHINADVFIPVLGKDRIIAYIIIERDAREHLYGHFERDKMIMYATYLANIIHLMQNRSLETLIHQEKELKEELYNKHQELNQYRESIRSFLKRTEQRLIGIIFYKNRRFVFGNHAAKQLIKINPNSQEGHPLVKALKHIARQTDKYKTSQKIFTKDKNNHELILCAVPNLEQNNVIIMAYYPDIVDIVKKQIDHLKDPSEWDYLLYLETTESGKLINQLIPGSGEILLNFKINLLKTALSKKATLLHLAEEDLLPTIEILHHISLRKTLHTIKLDRPINNLSIGIQLFGINPLFGQSQERSVLERLDGVGTLFIQNIEYLDITSQQNLAQCIQYGYFTILKSDQRVSTSVRIICSTNQDLALLVQEGQFSQELFNELKQTSLVMPPIDSLPDDELHELAKGFSQQFFKTQEFNNVLTLTDKDKIKLTRTRPMSLQELKEKIGKIVTEKSKNNLIYQETKFDPAFEISDPELIEAARLGRHALRDAKIMTLLWSKFKNQNKIATFLGVNRSSVNRRCKEYNLQ